VDVPKVHCRPDWPQVGILEQQKKHGVKLRNMSEQMGGSSIDHLYKWVISCDL
jgi:lambda repressor-like predicted transcriptional regulator